MISVPLLTSCKKDKENSQSPPSKSTDVSFDITIKNQGDLPDTVLFRVTSTGGKTYKWNFGDGTASTDKDPTHIYTEAKTFQVKLTVTSDFGVDSLAKSIDILLNKPRSGFSFAVTTPETLPVPVTFENTTTGTGSISYLWSFGDGSSTDQKSPVHNYAAGGLYTVKLLSKNAGGNDSTIKQIRISPYPQNYTNFNGQKLDLYAWEGNKVVLLSKDNLLNRAAMFKWLKAADATYEYYQSCTGREPGNSTQTFINNRTTIAEVPSTCGAGCGYLGSTGIEMQNTYFQVMYNAIANYNQYDQTMFYEFGRNFWFYGKQLQYKENDPVVTGYAVFMRFMAMEHAGIKGAPFGAWSFQTFRTKVENLVDTYMADPTLNWANTLGAGKGVPGSDLGATDLFASFCFRLRRDYGGNDFVQQIWKKTGLRPEALTTQDAVDNFFLASCAAANKNLTSVFQGWKWPLSTNAVNEALKYP